MMLEFPLVSILMPLHNKEPYISEAIKSVLNQTYPNIELIIIDDGSTDESFDIAKQFESDRVSLYKQNNRGVSAARNTAFEYSKGDFIQYLDADDILDIRKIEEQVNILRGYPNSTLATAKRFYFKKELDEIWQPKELLILEKNYDDMSAFLLDEVANSILLHAWLIPRSLIEKADKWDESMTIFEDRDFYLRLVPLASKIIYCPNAICYYRLLTKEHHAKRHKRTDLNTILSYFSRFETHFNNKNSIYYHKSRLILACLYKKLLNIANDKLTINELYSRSIKLGLAPNCSKNRFIHFFEKTIGVKNTFWFVFLKSKFIDKI